MTEQNQVPVYNMQTIPLHEIFDRFSRFLTHGPIEQQARIANNDPGLEKLLSIIKDLKAYAWVVGGGCDLMSDNYKEPK